LCRIRGGESEEPAGNPAQEAAEGAAVVAFERELAFERLEAR
jgi:hypothetical protein